MFYLGQMALILDSKEIQMEKSFIVTKMMFGRAQCLVGMQITNVMTMKREL